MAKIAKQGFKCANYLTCSGYTWRKDSKRLCLTCKPATTVDKARRCVNFDTCKGRTWTKTRDRYTCGDCAVLAATPKAPGKKLIPGSNIFIASVIAKTRQTHYSLVPMRAPGSFVSHGSASSQGSVSLMATARLESDGTLSVDLILTMKAIASFLQGVTDLIGLESSLLVLHGAFLLARRACLPGWQDPTTNALALLSLSMAYNIPGCATFDIRGCLEDVDQVRPSPLGVDQVRMLIRRLAGADEAAMVALKEYRYVNALGKQSLDLLILA